MILMTTRIMILVMALAIAMATNVYSFSLPISAKHVEEPSTAISTWNEPLDSAKQKALFGRRSHDIFEHYKNRPRHAMTCNKFPRVCHAKGSAGPDCCRKSCVDVMTDARNCGQCGRRCRFGEACCKGNCVNVMYDSKNCGGCKKRCKKGSFCRYGMCSYAN